MKLPSEYFQYSPIIKTGFQNDHIRISKVINSITRSFATEYGCMCHIFIKRSVTSDRASNKASSASDI